MGVVPTAIVQPRELTNEVERERVAVLLDAVDASRVTTVYAPAGFGKTTAALKWTQLLRRRGRPVLWLAARAGIRTLDDFVAALRAATVAAGLDAPVPAATDPVDALLILLASGGGPRPVVVIDDAQRLPADVLDLIAQIVASARDAITLILISRSLARIPIARLRSLGYLVEVGPADLRFTLAETAQFMARKQGGPVDARLLQRLHEDTLGWPAGIVMASGICRSQWQGDATALRPSGLRREFESYFEEEVMALESRPIRDFLVDISVLDTLDPAACVAVTASDDSRWMLEQIEEMGLFIEAIDAERSSYRFHPLFRDMIVRRLNDRDPARAAELHRRASRHFAAIKDAPKAIEHARLSRDEPFLADQLDALAETLIYRGFLFRIDNLAATLPREIVAERPNLLLALAWRRLRSLAFRSAGDLIDQAETVVDRVDAAGDQSAASMKHFRRVIEHRRIMLSAARDEMADVERRSEALLNELGDDEPYLSCTLLGQLMSARRELYHFHDMLKLEAETRRALERPGSHFASIALKSSVAPTLNAQGKTDAAQEMLEGALALAKSIPGRGAGLAALPALPLAEILYDRGDLATARLLIDQHLPSARQWGFVDQLAAGHIVRARLLDADGDLDGALKALDETHLVAIECGLARLRAYVVGEQVRMLIRAGQPERARAAFRAGGFDPEGEPVPTMSPSRQHESVAISWLRLEMHDHRLVRARKVAKRWSEFVRRNGAIRSATMFELLLAEIAVLAGDRSEARRAVREAVTLAAQGGWQRIFVDEGEAIGSLLVEAYGDGPKLDAAPDQLALRLVAAFTGAPTFEPEEDYGLGSRLVNRELDILRMVGGGLRNREIGNRLGLTEGTVKWYMQQIYDKLGVRRRPQAVMRARQLGILA